MSASPNPLSPRSRTGPTLNLVVNGLVALAWLAGAVMFAGAQNPFNRQGPARASGVVIVFYIIISLMLIADLRNVLKTRGKSIEAVSGVLMWLGFLGGLTYYITDFPGSNWLGAAAALLVGLSFAARVIMTLRQAALPPA